MSRLNFTAAEFDSAVAEVDEIPINKTAIKYANRIRVICFISIWIDFENVEVLNHEA